MQNSERKKKGKIMQKICEEKSSDMPFFTYGGVENSKEYSHYGRHSRNFLLSSPRSPYIFLKN